jgi:hypothetical protein
VIELLEQTSFREKGGYVSSLSAAEVAYGNLVKPKRILNKRSGVTGWTLHDIRRTRLVRLSSLLVVKTKIVRSSPLPGFTKHVRCRWSCLVSIALSGNIPE